MVGRPARLGWQPERYACRRGDVRGSVHQCARGDGGGASRSGRRRNRVGGHEHRAGRKRPPRAFGHPLGVPGALGCEGHAHDQDVRTLAELRARAAGVECASDVVEHGRRPRLRAIRPLSRSGTGWSQASSEGTEGSVGRAKASRPDRRSVRVSHPEAPTRQPGRLPLAGLLVVPGAWCVSEGMCRPGAERIQAPAARPARADSLLPAAAAACRSSRTTSSSASATPAGSGLDFWRLEHRGAGTTAWEELRDGSNTGPRSVPFTATAGTTDEFRVVARGRARQQGGKPGPPGHRPARVTTVGFGAVELGLGIASASSPARPRGSGSRRRGCSPRKVPGSSSPGATRSASRPRAPSVGRGARRRRRPLQRPRLPAS